MIAGLILAAGRASRFGSDKRQALLASGQSVLIASLQPFIQTFSHIGLVIPEGDTFGLAVCRQLGVIPLINQRANQGIGTSLWQGVQWAKSLPNCKGLLVGLADMPTIQCATVQRLAQELQQQQRLIAPVFNGCQGHPRGIPSHLFATIDRAYGQSGAMVLDWASALCVPVNDAGVLVDIDTPAMLKQLFSIDE